MICRSNAPRGWPDFLKRFVAEPLPVDLFIRHMLQIKPVRNSRLVKIGVLHPDPKRSAEIANRLVELFIQRNLQAGSTKMFCPTELLPVPENLKLPF